MTYIKDDKAALSFSRAKKFSEFTKNELSHLAANACLSEKLVLGTARETVARFHEHWQAEKGNLPLSSDVIKAIEAHLRVVPIA